MGASDLTGFAPSFRIRQGRIENVPQGELRVDGGRVKAATRVSRADGAGAADPDPEVQETGRAITDADAKMIRSCVIYRDDIIALNKPPGLPVQGGSKLTRHVVGLGPALRYELDEDPRLVHRLDKALRAF